MEDFRSCLAVARLDSPFQRLKEHARGNRFPYLNWGMSVGIWELVLDNVGQIMSSHSGQCQEGDIQSFLVLLSWRCQGYKQESPFCFYPPCNISPVGCNVILIVTLVLSSLLLISPIFSPDPPQYPLGLGPLQSPVPTPLPPWPLPYLAGLLQPGANTSHLSVSNWMEDPLLPMACLPCTFPAKLSLHLDSVCWDTRNERLLMDWMLLEWCP